MVSKKAISPVVATALLLVVAVVAVVGFQSWFTTYQSGVNVKVEQESDSGSALTVDRLEVGGVVYVRNGGSEVVTLLNTSKIVDSDGAEVAACNSTTNLSVWSMTAKSVTSTDMGTCTLAAGTAYDVVLVTSKGVFTSTQLAR